MAGFKFSLQTVLDYKNQLLDAATAEYTRAQGAVTAQEKVLHEVEEHFVRFGEDLRQRQLNGISAVDAMMGETALRALEQQIKNEQVKLTGLKRKAEERRLSMVEAKKECASLEMLRKKKLTSYYKAEEKKEEKRIEELVSTSRVIAASDL